MHPPTSIHQTSRKGCDKLDIVTMGKLRDFSITGHNEYIIWFRVRFEHEQKAYTVFSPLIII